MPGEHPRQRQQPFQLRVADTASPYRIADIFGEVLVYENAALVMGGGYTFFVSDIIS